MKLLNSVRHWPWVAFSGGFAAAFGALFIIWGSQPLSPIARGSDVSRLAIWFFVIAGVIDCLMIPAGIILWVGTYASRHSPPSGSRQFSSSRGRHSLETAFPRGVAVLSTLVVGYAWFYSQTSYFVSDVRFNAYAERMIQLAAGLVLAFALFQWTYRYLVRKAASKVSVSLAPVVGISINGKGVEELVLADGTTMPLEVEHARSWPPDNMAARYVTLVLTRQSDDAIIYITKDGECWVRSE
jgi:hypothetical protein